VLEAENLCPSSLRVLLQSLGAVMGPFAVGVAHTDQEQQHSVQHTACTGTGCEQ